MVNNLYQPAMRGGGALESGRRSEVGGRIFLAVCRKPVCPNSSVPSVPNFTRYVRLLKCTGM